MKLFQTLLATAALASTASAFLMPVQGRGSVAMQAKKINEKVDLESPKVVNTIELKAGEKAVLCRCWQSGTFPKCDGAHVKHNEANGDNVGPVIVSAPKASS